MVAGLALWVLSAEGAQASSFVYVAPPKGKASPSIVVYGAPEAVSATAQADAAGKVALVPLAFPLPSVEKVRRIVVSPSILAFESTEPAVTMEKVAAIGDAAPTARAMPVVIRGGIVGSGFGSRAAPEAVRLPAEEKGKAAGRKKIGKVPGKPSGEDDSGGQVAGTEPKAPPRQPETAPREAMRPEPAPATELSQPTGPISAPR